MNYYLVEISLQPNTEVCRDIMAAALAEIGFESFETSEHGLSAYAPENLYDAEQVAELLHHPPLLRTKLGYKIDFLPDKDWNEEWEKNFFQPIVVDNQVIVHSTFHRDVPVLPYDIVIDPKMAFGTGHHATTELMLSYLLQAQVANRSFLDMGCGTAILAILAKKLGAQPVVAIDIDEWAYHNALDNIRLNNNSDIDVRLGDASLLGAERYDVIFANINRNILMQDIPAYAQAMHPHAALYISGFYEEDVPVLTEICQSGGLTPISKKVKEDWTALHFEKTD